MPRAYLREMGFTDATLAAALTEITGTRWTAIAGDTAADRLARRWAFDRLYDLAMASPARRTGPSAGSYAHDDPVTHEAMRDEALGLEQPSDRVE